MIDQLKKLAAEKAVDEIRSGMIVGLGSGSTFQYALERIAANEVANRPGRIEPRMLKRDRQHYPMMHDPRRELRRRLCMT